MGYGGGGSGGGGSGGSGGSGASGGSGYRRVGDDRTANIKVDNITSRDGKRGTDVDGIVEVNTTAHFIPPSGTTAERGSRGRGIFGGGYDAASPYPGMNILDYITIATLGDAHDFGDLSVGRSAKCGGSSATRGIFINGRFSPTGDYFNIIDYVTISSTGNAFDFGDLTNHYNPAAAGTSNQIRGVYGGGYFDYATAGNTPNLWLSNMGYYTIATKGDSSYFGELANKGRRSHTGSNTTRGIWGSCLGGTPGVAAILVNTIEYVSIMTTGNTQDFGDMTVARSNTAGSMTSSTRMVMQGSVNPSTYDNTIDYITMASLGDAIDFGDAGAGAEAGAALSSPTRGVFLPGTPSAGDKIEYITIATTGNSSEFGNLSHGRRVYGSVCDSHGGLG